jgi:hypothetical protein
VDEIKQKPVGGVCMCEQTVLISKASMHMFSTATSHCTALQTPLQYFTALHCCTTLHCVVLRCTAINLGEC